jgi:hypothetical protein
MFFCVFLRIQWLFIFCFVKHMQMIICKNIQVAKPFPAHRPLGTTLNESSAWLGTEWEGFLIKIIVV